jgi:hypothetical protein
MYIAKSLFLLISVQNTQREESTM